MNVKYLRSKATAQRMIRKNGAQFDWRGLDETEIDPVTELPVAGSEPQPTQKVWAVVLPPTGNPDQYRGAGGALDLSLVRRVIISTEALKFNPAPLHQILYKGEWWTYENNMDLTPDGETDILFKGMIRRT